jgi:hypothetical protein
MAQNMGRYMLVDSGAFGGIRDQQLYIGRRHSFFV